MLCKEYSYYQPFGDAAQPPPPPPPPVPLPQVRQPAASQQAANFDLNNLNFDIPQQTEPQAAPLQHLRPISSSFSGAGSLPALPVPDARTGGQPQEQAKTQPLTEADFRDITEGGNYGAGGPEFGIAGGAQPARRLDNTDAQLSAMGLGSGPETGRSNGGPTGGGLDGFPDFGAAFGGGGEPQQQQQQMPMFDLGRQGGGGSAPGSDFDFASQPSSQGGSGPASVGPPGSLQTLLGTSFPGLGGGQPGGSVGQGADPSAMGLNEFARGGIDPQAQRNDDGAMDIADLGDRSDQFSGADVGAFEQPTPSPQDSDFNYGGSPGGSGGGSQDGDPFAFAADEQQPAVVPYPDGALQPVGTLWALTQPQSILQARYNPLPDKGTYQSYPAYEQDDGTDPREAVRAVVAATPAAGAPGPGRAGWVAANSDSTLSAGRPTGFGWT